MKRIGSFLSAVFIFGSVGVTSDASKEFSWGSTVLKDERTGDVIDFYGPCDESPTGQDQVQSQRH